jgi:LmbE family N-acetylglucosaminyl deacetylase
MDLTQPLLGVFAHPDDETFGMGGTLALVHKHGGRVGVFSATRGNKGKLNLAEPLPEEELAQVREKELREAARILGVDAVYVRNYSDGSVDKIPQEELIGQIVEVIREFKPYTVVTFSREGGTGHRDHIAMHYAGTEAFLRALSFPHAPRELYYRGMPESVRAQLSAIRRQRRRTPGHYLEHPDGDHFQESDLERIDISEVIDLKEQAALAHATQDPKRFLDRRRQSSGIPDEFWLSEYFFKAWPR